jgi:hypothetical protein
MIHKGLSSLLVKQTPLGNSSHLNQNPVHQAAGVTGSSNNTAFEDFSTPNYINNMRKKIESTNNSNQLLQYNSELILANNNINKILLKETEDLAKIQKKREKLEKELSLQLKNSENSNNGNLTKSMESTTSKAYRYESDSFEEESDASTAIPPSTIPPFAVNALNLPSASARMASMRQSIAAASEQQSIPSPVKAAVGGGSSGSLSNYYSAPESSAHSLTNTGGLGSALQSKYSVSNETVRNVMQAAGLNKTKVTDTLQNTTTELSENKINNNKSDINGGNNDSALGQQKENSAANLSYSGDDVNKIIQLYSFRMNKWEYILIEDYNSSNMFHKCKLVGDNSTLESALASKGMSQWIDLKKKPIRGI